MTAHEQDHNVRDRIEWFAHKTVAPLARDHDHRERIDAGLPRLLGANGWLGSLLERPGTPLLNHVSYGHLHEALGAACSATRALVTVQDMVAGALSEWGTADVRDRWLPALLSGDSVAAFAMTEPHGGDPAHTQVHAEPSAHGYVLTGTKTWISFAQIAEVFLVFARTGNGVSAFVVPRRTRGVTVTPIRRMLGARGEMLGTLELSDCLVPNSHRLTPAGRAVPTVSTAALTIGRLGVAAGCVGITRACLATVREFTRHRAFGTHTLAQQPLMRRMICDMVVAVEAGRALYTHAAAQCDAGDPMASTTVMLAKYFCAAQAAQATRDAVQALGAAGCSADHDVERWFRDAKIMEIIEGPTEVNQILLGGSGRTSYEPPCSTRDLSTHAAMERSV